MSETISNRSMKIAVLLAIVALVALAVILVRAMSWTKPYYRDQHKSSIELYVPSAVVAER